MFDTSIVRSGAIAAPRRVALLTASILIHSLAIIGALALTVASTKLPAQSPRQLELYRAAEPPAAPPPPLGKPAASRETRTALPRSKSQPITAPPMVPDQTPVLSQQGPTTAPILTDTIGDGPIGDPHGIPGGVGEQPSPGGIGQAPLMPGGEVVSARVISRVEPRFPPALIHAVRSATVIVRCVIDKNGQIRDPEIMMSSFPPFNEAVMAALRQWKFAAGAMHGQPVDTWFELRVRFEVR